jgi:hypothetical protein
LLSTSQKPSEEIRLGGNENKVSIVSAPKNVKFIIPMGRSGITSNESTYGVIDSTTRTITHVKDIFPLNPLFQSQTTNSSSNSVVTTSLFDTDQRNEVSKDDSEDIPLLPNENSDEK